MNDKANLDDDTMELATRLRRLTDGIGKESMRVTVMEAIAKGELELAKVNEALALLRQKPLRALCVERRKKEMARDPWRFKAEAGARAGAQS